MFTVSKNMPPSNGDPSGPVIWARIFVMSAGLGAKAATPGGGSLANNDISRIKRAAHAGEMLLLMVVLNSSSSDQAMPMRSLWLWIGGGGGGNGSTLNIR